jgi:hypothetical protein
VTEPTQFRIWIFSRGATGEVHSGIMPVNRKYNLATLLAACDAHFAEAKQLMFEYILIAWVNDVDEQAHILHRSHGTSSVFYSAASSKCATRSSPADSLVLRGEERVFGSPSNPDTHVAVYAPWSLSCLEAKTRGAL